MNDEKYLTDKEFVFEFSKAVVRFKRPKEELAEILLVSLKTMRGWVQGKNLPEPTIRRAIINRIETTHTTRTF